MITTSYSDWFEGVLHLNNLFCFMKQIVGWNIQIMLNYNNKP